MLIATRADDERGSTPADGQALALASRGNAQVARDRGLIHWLGEGNRHRAVERPGRVGRRFRADNARGQCLSVEQRAEEHEHQPEGKRERDWADGEAKPARTALFPFDGGADLVVQCWRHWCCRELMQLLTHALVGREERAAVRAFGEVCLQPSHILGAQLSIHVG